jgi:hypothetical protein
MKRFRVVLLVSAALGLLAAASPAETGTRLVRQPRNVTRPTGKTQLGERVGAATAAGYSVQLNIVTRVVGASFYRTAVDITNNTASDGVTANYQYCYTSGGAYQGCTNPVALNLLHYDSFHEDDIIDYLGRHGDIPPSAADNSFGSFIVTFDGLPSNNGWEGTITGRIYNAADNADPHAGTVAIAFPGSLFFESATGSLVTIVRDTTTSGSIDAGILRTNLGVTNTALYNTTPGATVDFRITFYDVVTGNVVGDQIAPSHRLEAGEVLQINDVFSAAHIPGDIQSCIAFVDVTSAQGTNPDTIEGYVDILDAGTNDGAYFEMKCEVGCLNY